MSQRLIYVMDPMCSWCWGFAPVIDAIQARYPELAIHLVAGGLRPGQREPVDTATRQVLAEHWQAVEQASGQPFLQPQQLPDGFVYNTEPACRALVAGRELDSQLVWNLVKTIQQAFYASLADVTQPGVLVDLAESCGYSRTAFAASYDAESTRAALAADFAWTRDLGIAGFPTLLAQRDGQLALLTNGYQPADQVLALLSRWCEAGQAASAS
ncbi:disulfide bond formation protein DsbA [Pseudomonas sp. WN033]|nr:disulfide bond formation protein DsbA [Pseudomonas sp. WN033]